MDEQVQSDLAKEVQSPFHKQMLQDCKALVACSRRKMEDYYATWDKNDDIYNAILKSNKEDKAANERGEPERMVVPISYAQIQTFVAFCFSLFMQRDRFFELEGFTPEDDRPAKVGEALLARDLSKNIFEAKLAQFLLDIARFGVGVLKTTWSVEKQMVRKTVTKPGVTFLGVQLTADSTEEVTEWDTAFEGNRIVNVSPYRFFPDTRLPLTRFQEGEFCASEEVYSMSQLKQWEAEGVVAGVNFIRAMDREVNTSRGNKWDDSMEVGGILTPGAGVKGDGQSKKNVIITEVQRTIVPSQYMIEDEPLGPEEHPIKYVIWIANDNRVIKCEPMNYLHNEYTYSVAQFVYDNNKLMSNGLSDIMDQLQSVISWFINSRITNVRKVIGDKLVVNTSMVNMNDLKERRPVIRLTGAATGEIDRYIKQLNLQDVTTTHITDVKYLNDMLQMVTGINDSLLGTVRPGKRSATENRNTTSGAAARLRTLATIIFRSALEPCGRQMLSNLRDGLDGETYVKLLGQEANLVPEFVKVDKSALVGHYDFEVFDGTLPTERFYTAQALEELLTGILSNPQAAAVLGMDPKKLMMEALQLRGVRNPERFLLDPMQQQMMMQNAQPNTANGAVAGGTTATGPTGPNPGVPGTNGQPVLPVSAGLLTAGGTGGNGNGFPQRV